MRFMCSHTLPPNAVTAEQAREISKASQNDPKVKGYRSFMNLSEGKVFCIMEAADKKTVTDWFKKMNMPFDSVIPLEFEGERGTVREEARAPAMA